MFEKSYNYSNINGKYIKILYKSSGSYNIYGICVSNPKYNNYTLHDTLVNCLAIQVNKLPKHFSSSFFITDNFIKPYNGHIIYIPFRIIDSLFVVKPDIESKLMLLWIAKIKNIPTDIVYIISKFIDGSELELPVLI